MKLNDRHDVSAMYLCILLVFCDGSFAWLGFDKERFDFYVWLLIPPSFLRYSSTRTRKHYLSSCYFLCVNLDNYPMNLPFST